MHSVNQEFKYYKKSRYFSKSFLWYNIFHSIKKTPVPLPRQFHSFLHHPFFACLCFSNIHTAHIKTTVCVQPHVGCLFLNTEKKGAKPAHFPGSPRHRTARPGQVSVWPLSCLRLTAECRISGQACTCVGRHHTLHWSSSVGCSQTVQPDTVTERRDITDPTHPPQACWEGQGEEGRIYLCLSLEAFNVSLPSLLLLA